MIISSISKRGEAPAPESQYVIVRLPAVPLHDRIFIIIKSRLDIPLARANSESRIGRLALRSLPLQHRDRTLRLEDIPPSGKQVLRLGRQRGGKTVNVEKANGLHDANIEHGHDVGRHHRPGAVVPRLAHDEDPAARGTFRQPTVLVRTRRRHVALVAVDREDVVIDLADDAGERGGEVVGALDFDALDCDAEVASRGGGTDVEEGHGAGAAVDGVADGEDHGDALFLKKVAIARGGGGAQVEPVEDALGLAAALVRPGAAGIVVGRLGGVAICYDGHIIRREAQGREVGV